MVYNTPSVIFRWAYGVFSFFDNTLGMGTFRGTRRSTHAYLVQPNPVHVYMRRETKRTASACLISVAHCDAGTRRKIDGALMHASKIQEASHSSWYLGFYLLRLNKLFFVSLISTK